MKKAIFAIGFLLYCSTGFSQLTAEQAGIKKTFFNFLAFYKKNESSFNAFKLFKGKGKDNAPPFNIQWKEVDKYFTYLRSSVPYVGEAYINAEKEHFKFSDSCFKADPQDEIPAGFDYDRWAGGQESIQYTYKWYTSAKNKYVISITGNTAILKIGSELPDGSNNEKNRSWSFVPFVKDQGKWKMADNVYPMNDGN